MDSNLNLSQLFQSDDVTVTQLDNLPTQDLLNVDVKSNNGRFESVVTDSDLSVMKTERIPKNTRKQNTWAMACYEEWAQWRNEQSETLLGDHGAVPTNLASQSVVSMDYWLARFIVECRRKDGQNYPPNTLYNITTSIQRTLREDHGRFDVKLLDETNESFSEFRKALDSRMKTLTSAGIGIHRNRADPVTEQDEELLWGRNVIGFDSAKSLSYGVFFYNCKVFGFRGGDEHKTLDVSQYTVSNESGTKALVFRGRSSKNVQGGLKQRRVEPKLVKQFQNENNPRCIVGLFEKYLSLIPSSGPFYRKPLPNRCNGALAFSQQVVGINTLGKYMINMFQDANIEIDGRNIRNHSGKVTLCTRLYENNYDEQAIMARSGHRSNAVRDYKRPSLGQLQQVSDALQPPVLKKVKTETATSESQIEQKAVGAIGGSGTTSATVANSRIEICVPDCIDTVVINRNGKKVTITL